VSLLFLQLDNVSCPNRVDNKTLSSTAITTSVWEIVRPLSLDCFLAKKPADSIWLGVSFSVQLKKQPSLTVRLSPRQLPAYCRPLIIFYLFDCGFRSRDLRIGSPKTVVNKRLIPNLPAPVKNFAVGVRETELNRGK